MLLANHYAVLLRPREFCWMVRALAGPQKRLAGSQSFCGVVRGLGKT
jgi:hypothetical protein